MRVFYNFYCFEVISITPKQSNIKIVKAPLFLKNKGILKKSLTILEFIICVNRVILNQFLNSKCLFLVN